MACPAPDAAYIPFHASSGGTMSHCVVLFMTGAVNSGCIYVPRQLKYPKKTPKIPKTWDCFFAEGVNASPSRKKFLKVT